MFRPPTYRWTRSVTLLLVLGASRLSAQCPDGSPPPCGRAVVAARRTTPAIDPRAWIVVPFGNAMKAQELDWLRDASVNLLSLDLGRWSDIRVVPDKRVADLMRELPASRLGQPLSLSDGLTIARRAGAGMLVMGDFFRLGRGARLVANVFDVRTGAKVRSAVQQATEQDSLLTAFTPLARTVLAVPPPSDARMGDLGTTSLGAYQAYLAAIKASNRDDMAEARTLLMRALAIDSTFALAHFKLSQVLAWGEADPNGGETRAHALAAARLGTGLPRRERALVDAQVAIASNDFGTACGILKPMVAADSSDIEALAAFGECSFHENRIERSAADTTVGRFVGDWNVALRAFKRVLELDPSYHVGFEHILDILRSTARGGCIRQSPCVSWTGIVLREGDSLEIVPVVPYSDAYWAQVDRAARDKSAVRNLDLARRMAREWFDADTTSEKARHGMGRVLLATGDVAGAYEQFRHMSMRPTRDNAVPIRNWLEASMKLGHGAEARALFDSLVKSVPDQASVLVFRGGMDLVFGHLKRLETALTTASASLGMDGIAYNREIGRVALGIPRPELAGIEAAWARAKRDSSCDRVCVLTGLSPTLIYALRLPRATWPAIVDGKMPEGRFNAALALAHNDTAALRQAAVKLEKDARDNIAMGWPEFAWSAIAADAYLVLRDSASALRVTRFFVDTAMGPMPIGTRVFGGAGFQLTGAPLWPRMMLLRADLAAAAGAKAEAAEYYDRVLSLWSTADAELAPLVERIRKSRAGLGRGAAGP